jgi:hypothetical protein
MKRYQKFLFYMLIGLLVAPLCLLATNVVSVTGKQTITVTVNNVNINIVPSPETPSILQVGKSRFADPFDQNGPFNTWLNAGVRDNYAEFLVTGAKGYSFHYSFNYNGINNYTKLTKGSNPNGVTVKFELQGADQANPIDGYDGTPGSFQQIPNSGQPQIATLGNFSNPIGKYYMRVSITYFRLDKGLSSGDYVFPVFITVGYEPSI